MKEKVITVVQIIGEFILGLIVLTWVSFMWLYLLKPITQIINDSFGPFWAFILVITNCVALVYLSAKIAYPLWDKAFNRFSLLISKNLTAKGIKG